MPECRDTKLLEVLFRQAVRRGLQFEYLDIPTPLAKSIFEIPF